MSASNWTTCPRCLDRARREHDEARAAVMASYGKVPVEEFDRRREVAAVEPREDDFETFREDYEIYGAERGEVVATYGGGCTECGLSAELNATRRFYKLSEVGGA